MNATFILQDLMENKPFFQLLTKRQNMQKLFETAFRSAQPDGEQYKDSSFETQGLISRIIDHSYNQLNAFNGGKKNRLDDDAWDNPGDDDDIIGIELSDEENDESKSGNVTAILELLQQMIAPIKTLLEKNPLESVQN